MTRVYLLAFFYIVPVDLSSRCPTDEVKSDGMVDYCRKSLARPPDCRCISCPPGYNGIMSMCLYAASRNNLHPASSAGGSSVGGSHCLPSVEDVAACLLFVLQVTGTTFTFWCWAERSSVTIDDLIAIIGDSISAGPQLL